MSYQINTKLDLEEVTSEKFENLEDATFAFKEELGGFLTQESLEHNIEVIVARTIWKYSAQGKNAENYLEVLVWISPENFPDSVVMRS